MCVYYHIATNFILPKVICYKKTKVAPNSQALDKESCYFCSVGFPDLQHYYSCLQDPPYKNDPFYQIRGFLTQ